MKGVFIFFSLFIVISNENIYKKDSLILRRSFIFFSSNQFLAYFYAEIIVYTY